MANTYKRWKGAVEPAETSPAGNEYKRWKGAVEPAKPAAATGGNLLLTHPPDTKGGFMQ